MWQNHWRDIAARQVMDHEGLKLTPYRCTAGKLTIGYGRNLEDVGITQEEAVELLDHDLDVAQTDLSRSFAWWKTLDPGRRVALLDMRFQLGAGGFRKFTKMLAALERGDFTAAAKEARDSKWAKTDCPARAKTVTRQLETGEI